MKPVVVITGANRGIGLEFVKQFSQQGAEVWAVCRAASSALVETGANVIEGVNIAEPSSIGRIAQALGATKKIDILINNAGILRDEVLGELNYETINEQFQVNTLGALRVTESLLEHLASPSKVILITSRMGSIEDNTSGGRYGYRMSKAALNAAGKSLAHDLKSNDVAVGILHPGFVATDMVGGRGNVSANQAVSMLMERIDALNIENSGTFWHANGEVLPW